MDYQFLIDDAFGYLLTETSDKKSTNLQYLVDYILIQNDYNPSEFKQTINYTQHMGDLGIFDLTLTLKNISISNLTNFDKIAASFVSGSTLNATLNKDELVSVFESEILIKPGSLVKSLKNSIDANVTIELSLKSIVLDASASIEVIKKASVKTWIV